MGGITGLGGRLRPRVRSLLRTSPTLRFAHASYPPVVYAACTPAPRSKSRRPGWLDFLERVFGTKDVLEGSFLDGIDKLPVDEALAQLAVFKRHLDSQMGMDADGKLRCRFPWLETFWDVAGSTEKDIQAEGGHGFFHWELHFAHVFKGERGGFDPQVGGRAGGTSWSAQERHGRLGPVPGAVRQHGFAKEDSR